MWGTEGALTFYRFFLSLLTCKNDNSAVRIFSAPNNQTILQSSKEGKGSYL